jgi:hypothetical protein
MWDNELPASASAVGRRRFYLGVHPYSLQQRQLIVAALGYENQVGAPGEERISRTMLSPWD